MDKKIANIVFYSENNVTKSEKKATIFYTDGTVKKTSYQEGISACKEVAKERGIKTKNAFQEMINNNIIHVLSKEEFDRRYTSFIPTQFYEAPKDDITLEEIFRSGNNSDLSDSEDDEYDFYYKSKLSDKVRKAIKGIGITATSLLIAFGFYSCVKKNTKAGIMNNSLLTSISADNDNNISQDKTLSNESNNKSNKSDADIQALLDRTINDYQSRAMRNIKDAMDAFNIEFANNYLEKGLDVKATLKFEEMVSLQLAYNGYSREKLTSIYNGADFKSEDLSRAYKDASLQLMGAYAIENSEHPVDISMLIESKKGQEFYQKYHKAFLKAKEATGEEKIKLVKKFYKMVREDFPISEKKRTEGISHSENYDSIEAYKFAVTPMIAAAEMMWQNLDIDVTLDDMEIDFLNDLGLCNYADKTFERVELLVMSFPVNTNNPTYEEYKKAFIIFYVGKNAYYIDDEHRELTILKAFQDSVNWHFEIGVGASYQGSTTTSTTTKTVTSTKTTSSTTYSTETTVTKKPITEKAKEEVDKEIENKNAANKAAAEKKAAETLSKKQAQEDAKANAIEKQVKKDEETLSKNIAAANNTINKNNEDTNTANNNKVNENDIGQGAKFDSNHSDSNGNLNGSVQNITTDSTGDKTNDPLPDPNETGRKFDAKANSTTTSGSTNNSSSPKLEQWTTSEKVADDTYYENSWTEYETAVNSYVNSMANSQTEGTGYQYQR